MTLQRLIDAVRRRLRKQRLARALHVAAWATVAALIASSLVHWFLWPVSLTDVCAVAALPWVMAIGWAISRRSTADECAAWADRHLGGASAYATMLEMAEDRHAGRAEPALERLEQWVNEALPHSLAMLAARPLRTRLAKPLAAALVCTALTTALIQIPARHTPAAAAQSPRGAATPQASAAAVATTARDDRLPDVAPEATIAGQPVTPRGAAQAREALSNPGVTQQRANAARTAGAAPLAAAPGAVATSSRAGSGGREAGDSSDTSADTGLSESWQGALAEKLLSSTAAVNGEPARADPTRAADYGPAPGPPDASSATALALPAPAVAPEAHATARLGPAEQEYVRAYFAGSGAGP